MHKKSQKATAIGINHVALEVGDVDAALRFYGELINFKLRGREDNMAFIDLGDQFINLSAGRSQGPDTKRHFGLVVDDREAVRDAVQRLGCKIMDSPFLSGLDFLDPWGNHVQVVEYQSIQFCKTPGVLKGMGLAHIEKTAEARKEIKAKGLMSEPL